MTSSDAQVSAATAAIDRCSVGNKGEVGAALAVVQCRVGASGGG